MEEVESVWTHKPRNLQAEPIEIFAGDPATCYRRSVRSIGFHPLQIHAWIESDESSELEAEVLVLGVLNTPSYGAGMRVAPEARIDDGRLDLVLVEDLPLFQILRLLPRLLTHGELRTKRVRRETFRRIRIETRTPAKFHGDGEILGWTPVEIEVVPRAIRMLCPRNGLSEP